MFRVCRQCTECAVSFRVRLLCTEPAPLPAGALSANASCVQLRLHGWPSACEVTAYEARLRPAGGAWRQAGAFGAELDVAELCGLRPATVYQLVVSAHSAAGTTESAAELATTTLHGGERARVRP